MSVAVLTARRAEIRQKLGTIAEVPVGDLTDEQVSERDALFREIQSVEPQLAAAEIAAQEAANDDEHLDNPDGRTLRDRATVTGFIRAAIHGETLDGAHAELAAERGLPLADGFLPLDALDPDGGLQVRADASAGSPTGSPRTATLMGRIFADGLAGRLGVTPDRVAYGQKSYSVITAGASPAFTAEDGAKDSEASSWTTKTVLPIRLSAAYRTSHEDVAANGPDLERAFASDLRAAAADALDDMAIGGNGTAPNPSGIEQEVTDPTAATTTVSYATALSTMYGLIDPIYAPEPSDITMLCRPAVTAKLAGLNPTNEDAHHSLYVLMRDGFKIVNTDKTKAGASNVHTPLIYKSRHAGPHGRIPVWEGMQIVRDSISRASHGQIRLTLIMLANVAIVRTAPYDQISLKLA